MNILQIKACKTDLQHFDDNLRVQQNRTSLTNNPINLFLLIIPHIQVDILMVSVDKVTIFYTKLVYGPKRIKH